MDFAPYNVLICIFQNGCNVKLRCFLFTLNLDFFSVFCDFITSMTPVTVS